jgi:hypothetical protein
MGFGKEQVHYIFEKFEIEKELTLINNNTKGFLIQFVTLSTFQYPDPVQLGNL